MSICFGTAYTDFAIAISKTSTDGKPLYFVTLDANEDPREDWNHVRTFGGINGEPWITKFRIKVNSTFRCVYYKNGNEWHGSDGPSYSISLGSKSSPLKSLVNKDNSFREVYQITYNLKDKGLLQNILSEEAGYTLTCSKIRPCKTIDID